MPKSFTTSDIVKILDHDRTRIGWLVRASGDGGKIEINRMTRIAVQYPRDGAGRLTVAVTDWTGREGQDPVQYIGRASGYGYDKLTAALDGATIAGVVVGDHCNQEGRPTWKTLVDRLSYEGDGTGAAWHFAGLS